MTHEDHRWTKYDGHTKSMGILCRPMSTQINSGSTLRSNYSHRRMRLMEQVVAKAKVQNYNNLHQNDNKGGIELCFEGAIGESSEDDEMIPELEDFTMVESSQALPGQ